MKLTKGYVLLAAIMVCGCGNDGVISGPGIIDECQGENCPDDNPGDDNPGDDNPGDDNPGDACETVCLPGATRCSAEESWICAESASGCPEWKSAPCADGTVCDEDIGQCIQSCTEVCDPAEPVRCTSEGVARCEPDATGCAVWNVVETCVQGTHCDESTGTCESGCAEVCPEGARLRCTEEGIEECNSDESGCAEWSLDPCEPGTYCDEGEMTCVACAEVCPETPKRCTAGGIETCSADAHGCAQWTVETTCEAGQSCDAATLTCVDGCKTSCDAGAKQCNGAQVQECRVVSGCPEWTVVETCGTGYACEGGTCVVQCINACEAGKKRCSGQKVQECRAQANGCLAWVDSTTCSDVQTCNASTATCEYTCGSDCAPFTIVLLPDTQNYTRSSNGIYKKQLQWIVDNKTKENIKFVIHLGDITNNNTTEQWKIASAAHEVLDKAKIPYAIATGNHDYINDSPSRGASKFKTYFNDARMNKAFGNPSWFSGYKYDTNSYSTFKVGNIPFLVLALEYAPRKDVICWANEVIKKHPDHRVIVETHSYLTHNSGTDDSKYAGGADGRYVPYGLNGKEVYNELVSRHSNVIMAVGGHVGDSEFRQKKGNTGNVISEMLVDYQFEKKCSSGACSAHCLHEPDSGNGWMRTLKFDPKTNKVTAKSFTVMPNSYFSGSKPQFYCSELVKTLASGESTLRNWYPANKDDKVHQFSFECPFASPVNYKFSDKGAVTFGTRVINGVGDGQQEYPAVAVNRQTGTFVAVWEDDSSSADGSGHDIAARIFYGGGCNKVSQFFVNAETAGDQGTPDVAMDKDGNFVVVWADDKDANGVYEIFMRGFDASGKERFARKTVNSVAKGQQRNPAIAMNPNGQFVVVWEDESNGADTPQVFVRGFNADGSQRFADRNVEGTVQGSRRKPDVGIADDGTFVVTWEDDKDANGAFQVYAKGFNADGSDRLKTFVVNSVSDGQQLNPSIGMNGDGTFYIAYEDDADKNGVYRVKARGYNAAGTQIFADTHISAAGEKISNPVVCVAASGNAVFGWHAAGLNNGDIRRRSYNLADKKLGDAANANSVTTGIQRQPALGCTDAGKTVWLWSDDIDGNGYYEIYGRGL